MNEQELLAGAKRVLANNSQDDYTVPSRRLYPHQWLWDSSFIAIGLARYEPKRAAGELESLMRGQWKNGMLPHIIFSRTKNYWLDQRFWRSNWNPVSPRGILTSGISQPPMVAIAAERVAAALKPSERKAFIAGILPGLVKYHLWWYRQRDPRGTGLVVLVHPWENGLDNTPPWSQMLANVQLPLWIRLLSKIGFNWLADRVRPDTRIVAADQRLSFVDAERAVVLAARLRSQRYNSRRILRDPIVAIESLTTNCILAEANAALAILANEINETLPQELQQAAKRTIDGIHDLWDEQDGQFYSRNYMTGELIKAPSINTFFPLIAGVPTPEQAERLVKLLAEKHQYWTKYPVPTVSIDCPGFDDKRYWQGPTWINTNWLIIQGLRRYGYDKFADQLKSRSLDLVAKSGFNEYFSPLDGQPYGIDNFSWTAALTIDLLLEK